MSTYSNLSTSFIIQASFFKTNRAFLKQKMNWSPVHKFIIIWINSFGLPVQIKSNEEWSSRNLCNCVRSLKKIKNKKNKDCNLSVLIFFQSSYAIAKIGFTTARIIIHLTSFPQFLYDLFHKIIHLSQIK